MACMVLNVVDEVFGPSITPSVVGAMLQRGEWLGLTLASEINGSWVPVSSQTYDINGTSIELTRDASGQTVTASVAGVMLSLPWRAPTAGATNLLAAKFRAGADFVVVRDADSSVTPTQWRLWIFDVRGIAVPQPVALGPFAVPSGNDLNVCPNANGQMLLLWHGSPSGVAQGRRAWVQRTELDANAVPAFVVVDDPTAQGTLGAQVAAAARTITIFDDALRNGNVSVARTANSRNLMSASLPAPGKPSLAPQSLTLGASENARSFTVSNVGGDFLSLDSVTVDKPTVVSLKLLVTDPCILPGGSVPVEVDRISQAAATATVTVSTTPAASPASAGKVSVDVKAAPVTAPNPKLALVPAALSWRTGQSDTRSLTLKNIGNVALDVSVGPSPAGSGFAWVALSLTTLQPSKSVSVTVQPLATGPDQDTLAVQAMLAGTSTALTGFPASVPLKKNVTAKVPVGTLRITALLADPPGLDIEPEGEFIEIANVTANALDLTGTSISHELRSTPSSHPPQRTLVKFGANAFGADSMLQPLSITGRPLRVRDVTGTISLGGFFGSAGSSGPDGQAGSTGGSNFPLPGGPSYCLIGCIGKLESDGSVTQVVAPFFVGSDSVVTVALDRSDLTFFLGVNDDVLWDNGGSFDAAVDLSR